MAAVQLAIPGRRRTADRLAEIPDGGEAVVPIEFGVVEGEFNGIHQRRVVAYRDRIIEKIIRAAADGEEISFRRDDTYVLRILLLRTALAQLFGGGFHAVHEGDEMRIASMAERIRLANHKIMALIDILHRRRVPQFAEDIDPSIRITVLEHVTNLLGADPDLVDQIRDIEAPNTTTEGTERKSIEALRLEVLELVSTLQGPYRADSA
jgi:hypothetical protein